MLPVYFYNSAAGQLKNGVELGPITIANRLKEKGYDINIIEPINQRQSRDKNILNYNIISSDCKQLYDSIIQNNHNKPLFLGGDHSMGIGSVAAMLHKYPNLFVIWIDAHADINTSETSLSNNIHGMPVSQLTNLERKHKFEWIRSHLPFENLLYIGIRDLDPSEIEIVKNNQIKVITVNNIKMNGIKNVLYLIKNLIGNNPIHISLDVDGIDPSYIPSTGTTASEGLDLYDIIYLIESLNNDQLKSMDIVEFNPMIGTDDQVNISLKNISKLIKAYWN
ncbi:ureohydrolase [Fadolivirus algeromassiliense]|jgi:arginase|uniref:Arginase n=1 Tax=Fadolivirus FV1/VV64 TaxID=3070911 RepID=A0A7D3R0C1_9VIRU|nr:ureohydrolase [Fadolivirus algeromassiliense]QKF93541.1 ureohydrolase [Fadolivirus FV1/VV64]